MAPRSLTPYALSIPNPATENPPVNPESAARALARQALKGLSDKGHKPVFDHVARVALAQTTDSARLAGWLHDLVEDTSVTLDEIRNAFGAAAAHTVELLTRHPDETYRHYIHRLKTGADPDALAVKLADLNDHLDPARIDNLTGNMRRRYHRARSYLDGRIDAQTYLS